MTKIIEDFVAAVFKNNIWLGVIIIAIIPIIELKGAIPFAMAFGAMNVYKAFLFSYIGSVIPAFLIVFFLPPVFEWMKKFKFSKKIALFFEERFKKSGEKIKDKSKTVQSGENKPSPAEEELTPAQLADREMARKKKADKIKFFGILAFVAFPVPLTGVWTGSAIAVFLGMKRSHSLPAVLIGNFIAGLIISIVSVVFDSPLTVFYVIFGVFFAIFLFVLIRDLIKRARKKQTEKEN